MDTTVSDADAKKAVSTFASGTKVATANVADASGTQTIEVRKDKDKNYYAKSSVVEGIYKVTADLGDGLDKDLNSFRQKKLFDFGFNDPTKLTVNKTTYEKSGEKWMSGGKQMDSSSIQAVVDKLRDLASTKFLDSGSGPTVMELAVTSNDGKRNEKVTIMKQGATRPWRDIIKEATGEPLSTRTLPLIVAFDLSWARQTHENTSNSAKAALDFISFI